LFNLSLLNPVIEACKVFFLARFSLAVVDIYGRVNS